MRLLLLNVVAACAACGPFQANTVQCRGGPGLMATTLKGTGLSDRTLALTFDGGPTAITPAIGDFLSANDIRAAFFVDGRFIGQASDGLARLKARGHLVGQRGYSGSDLNSTPEPALEVRTTDAMVAPYVTGDMYLLRSTSGSFNDALTGRLNAAGLNKYVGPIGWDVGTTGGEFLSDQDCLAQGQEASRCAQYYIDRLRTTLSGVVRLHTTDPASLAVVQFLVPKLKNEGYAFVRLDEVPPIRLLLERAGGTPGTIGGGGGCNEY